MALALLKARLGQRLFVDSCGLKRPGEPEPDPFAVAVMDELGLDLAGHRPKTFDDLEDDSFDLVISLSPEAHHRALEMGRARSVEIVYWPTPDPTLVEGSREQKLDAYRTLRDGLEARIAQRFARPSTFGG